HQDSAAAAAGLDLARQTGSRADPLPDCARSRASGRIHRPDRRDRPPYSCRLERRRLALSAAGQHQDVAGQKMWRAEVDGKAGIERGSRIAVLIAVTLGSLFTLLALLAQIAALKSEHGLDRTISAVCSISTILLSWLL